MTQNYPRSGLVLFGGCGGDSIEKPISSRKCVSVAKKKERVTKRAQLFQNVLAMNVSTGQLPFSSNAYRKNDSFFTELTVFKAVLYSITTLYVTSVAVIALIEPLLTLPCDVPYDNMEFPNPDFVGIKCRRLRHAMLLGMNLEGMNNIRMTESLPVKLICTKVNVLRRM